LELTTSLRDVVARCFYEVSDEASIPLAGLGRLGELYDIVIKCGGLGGRPSGCWSRAGPHALVSWITWMIAILVAWPLVGLGVAYLFGCFVRGAEALGN